MGRRNMKKQILFLIGLSIFVLTPHRIQANWVVCIDPGHGGIGANKYYNGGDGNGGAGLCQGIAEQWVDFNVACALRDTINYSGFLYTPIMTRQSQDDPDIGPIQNDNLWYRANYANYAKAGVNIYDRHADQFVSVHHNGLGPNNQGIEVFWCSRLETDSGYSRCLQPQPACRDSLLAWKIQLSLKQAWDYEDRCKTKCSGSGWYCCDAQSKYLVLRRTVMVSALSEGSNLSNCAEESLFNDPYMVHTNQEAGAIFHGWASYIEWGGVSCISYCGLNNWTGRMLVDNDTVVTPYYACWTPGDIHTLQCQDTLDFKSGWAYKFSHWSQELLGQGVDPRSCWINTHFDTIWTFIVPQGENSYYAYMKGGPTYRDSVYSPNGGEVWAEGEEHPIRWFAFEGADTTTLIDVYLSVDGGSSWEIIVTGLPNGVWEPGDEWTAQYYWTITATPSTQCRIKVRAYDCAGNDTFDISNNNFTINCAPKPNAPSNLYTLNTGCDSRITLDWHDNSNNEDGFNIYRNGVWIASVGADVTSFMQTYLVQGQSYSYYVKAKKGDCESTVSNTITQTPSNITPEAPTNLQVVNVGECQYRATWEDNSNNEDGFALYTHYTGYTCRATTGPNVTSYQGYWNLEADWAHSHDFFVYAFDGDCKAYSNHVVIEPPGGVIHAPVNLQLEGSNCDWTAMWQNGDNYDFCEINRLHADCDEEPCEYSTWYSNHYISSCGQNSIPIPWWGCGCFCVKVRGGKYVNCGSLGSKKWSGYSDRPCESSVYCYDHHPGCPYLDVYDGEKFIAENTILAPAEASPDRRQDVNDYYLIQQSVTLIDNLYKMRIAEFESEHSFFDQVELLAVDHDFNEKVAVVGEDIFVYDPADYVEPISCYNDKVANQDFLLRSDPEEQASLSGPGFLVLDFGPVPPDSGTPILSLPCCGGGGSGHSKAVTKLTAEGEPVPQIGLLVEAEKEGIWQPLDSIPARMTQQEFFVDLSNFAEKNQNLKIKLSWDERGYSFSKLRCFRAERFNRPEPLTLTKANHSEYGDVTPMLTLDDNDYVELIPNQHIDLDFSTPPLVPGKVRDLIFKCNGHYLMESSAKVSVNTPSPDELQQNYPNPFNPQTQIEFTLEEDSKVSLVIYNLLGQKVVSLLNENLPSGKHVTNWDGLDESRQKVASGIYFYRIQFGQTNEMRKMILMK